MEVRIIRQKVQTSSKSEFQLVLEFIGYRNLVIIGLIGSIYFVSATKNYLDGLPFLRAFSPFYALHFHDGGRFIGNVMNDIGSWFSHQQDILSGYIEQIQTKVMLFVEDKVKPFFDKHPVLGLTFIVSVGFTSTILLLAFSLIIIKKALSLLAIGSAVSISGGRSRQHHEEIWSFDPHRKPSEEQLKITQKNLEKLVQRAPVLGGHVPKNVDSSLRELAARNKDSDYNYRNAIYVMGPIKGTKFDNQYEIPIALDQIKKVSNMMKQSSIYETLPLDLVILRAKKGSNNWEVEPSIAPVSLGKSFPVKVIEKVMLQHRNSFIWDQRAVKSKTGYGTR